MPPSTSGPAPRSTIVDLYFMENRAKLIDIAAFLDRVERAEDDLSGRDDFRVAALREAIEILRDGQPQRAARMLDQLSDHSTTPLESAADMKGAYGAPPRDP